MKEVKVTIRVIDNATPEEVLRSLHVAIFGGDGAEYRPADEIVEDITEVKDEE